MQVSALKIQDQVLFLCWYILLGHKMLTGVGTRLIPSKHKSYDSNGSIFFNLDLIATVYDYKSEMDICKLSESEVV